ncbi:MULTISPECIES: winged helix-turn-helix domain-containing protein [Nonomuraea]|uniref:Winged helix-turn-helix domain-containing protein n=1 Tax=Nonomuraea ferruginea TaxID=46174 RepID=A0ABT4SUB5_9ACTN|nr:winged helix-turn-helix domain-containing protein [Nonomuraea ferruginea]MDA0640665.1 winged helix-turn-helix domain-containing protein [Nonomuraea ferruginea]
MLPDTPWTEDDWNPEFYRYEQIADWIQQRIEAGEYPPRTVLSEIQLQGYFGTGRTTIRKAFEILRERGLIITKPGRGSVVMRRAGTTD